MFKLLVTVFRPLLLPRSRLLLENLALRHQLAVLKRSSKRPRLRGVDRHLSRSLDYEPLSVGGHGAAVA